MLNKFTIFIFLLNTLLLCKAAAQGCSDAGFCTIGHLKQLQAKDEAKQHQKISVLLPLGVGDESVFVFTPGLQYDNQFNKNWALQAKLTANTASGNLGSATGLGDLFFHLRPLFTGIQRSSQLSKMIQRYPFPRMG